VNSAGNWWHIGDLPASIGELARTADQFCWAILANTRDDGQLCAMRRAIDNLGWTIKNGISDWPAGNPI
jgi:hypothetical protein